eukprot:CAMPEP_0176443302 /NCGR_PEP_ID=MMETSP0127-20121128/22339_1 /TAXON_ID=938130 /ORGANISM="Platyophrya macrostoma, Strain WH" /LENGTH=53 /DNA_ID=CAMNT_0017828499 /DNA_START=114 /DNA_END=271 /DNA_ORIENTATION=+
MSNYMQALLDLKPDQILFSKIIPPMYVEALLMDQPTISPLKMSRTSFSGTYTL